MPWDLQIDMTFLIGYLGYIINLVKINGVPLYMIVLALIIFAWFFSWVGYLAEFFIDRFTGGS